MLSKGELNARKVLDECGLESLDGIDMQELIMGRGAFYEERAMEGKEGETVSSGDNSFICINSNIKNHYKKRFAQAHELGHYEMHRGLMPVFIDSEEDMVNWYKKGPQEQEANEFAAEILMPESIFSKNCERKKFNPKVIDELSEKFKVSKTAVILRFVKFGNHPIFVVYCKNNVIKWWKKSEDFYYYMEHQTNLAAPETSVAYEMFTEHNFYNEEERMQAIWKSDWFKMKESERDSRFYEYCMYVPSYGYSLSVIWEE